MKLLGPIRTLLRVKARRHETERMRLGRLGERSAARHLRRTKYRIVARNVRLPFGEADLVCLSPDRNTLVIVEVKSGRQRSDRFRPEDQITPDKQRTLRQLAGAIASRHGWTNRPTRIDVVAVEFDQKNRVVELRHHTGAV